MGEASVCILATILRSWGPPAPSEVAVSPGLPSASPAAPPPAPWSSPCMASSPELWSSTLTFGFLAQNNSFPEGSSAPSSEKSRAFPSAPAQMLPDTASQKTSLLRPRYSDSFPPRLTGPTCACAHAQGPQSPCGSTLASLPWDQVADWRSLFSECWGCVRCLRDSAGQSSSLGSSHGPPLCGLDSGQPGTDSQQEAPWALRALRHTPAQCLGEPGWMGLAPSAPLVLLVPLLRSPPAWGGSGSCPASPLRPGAPGVQAHTAHCLQATGLDFSTRWPRRSPLGTRAPGPEGPPRERSQLLCPPLAQPSWALPP